VTLERRSPLPKGRYWADMFVQPDFDQVAAMNEWLTANRGVVRLESSQSFDSDPPRTWYLFEVTGGPGGTFLPEWVGIGFPTIATADVHSSDDTVQKPDPEGGPAWGFGLILVGAGLLALALRDVVKGVVGK